MKLIKELQVMWLYRAQKSQRKPWLWWTEQYDEARERIEDYSTDDENPYWHGPTAEVDAMPGYVEMRDEFGADFTPETARKMAFELLVLADLTDIFQEGPVEASAEET